MCPQRAIGVSSQRAETERHTPMSAAWASLPGGMPGSRHAPPVSPNPTPPLCSDTRHGYPLPPAFPLHTPGCSVAASTRSQRPCGAGFETCSEAIPQRGVQGRRSCAGGPDAPRPVLRQGRRSWAPFCHCAAGVMALQVLLHYRCYCATSIIALQVSLRYRCFCAKNVIALQVLLRCRCHCATDVIALQVQLRCECYCADGPDTPGLKLLG